MALNAGALVTDTLVETWLGLAAGTASNQLIELINQVSVLVEKYCKRTFISTEHTEIMDGRDQETIYLKQWPILDTAGGGTDPVVYFDNDRDDVWTNVTSYNRTPLWINQTGELYFKYGYTFPKGRRNIKVVWTAGYAERDAIPEDLRIAVLELIAFYRAEITTGKHGVKTIHIALESTSYDFAQWPKKVLMALGPYRRAM